jgi:hypothetical protein
MLGYYFAVAADPGTSESTPSAQSPAAAARVRVNART